MRLLLLIAVQTLSLSFTLAVPSGRSWGSFRGMQHRSTSNMHQGPGQAFSSTQYGAHRSNLYYGPGGALGSSQRNGYYNRPHHEPGGTTTRWQNSNNVNRPYQRSGEVFGGEQHKTASSRAHSGFEGSIDAPQLESRSRRLQGRFGDHITSTQSEIQSNRADQVPGGISVGSRHGTSYQSQQQGLDGTSDSHLEVEANIDRSSKGPEEIYTGMPHRSHSNRLRQVFGRASGTIHHQSPSNRLCSGRLGSSSGSLQPEIHSNRIHQGPGGYPGDNLQQRANSNRLPHGPVKTPGQASISTKPSRLSRRRHNGLVETPGINQHETPSSRSTHGSRGTIGELHSNGLRQLASESASRSTYEVRREGGRRMFIHRREYKGDHPKDGDDLERGVDSANLPYRTDSSGSGRLSESTSTPDGPNGSPAVLNQQILPSSVGPQAGPHTSVPASRPDTDEGFNFNEFWNNIPRRSSSQIRGLFPWITDAQSTMDTETLPRDGKKRLYEPSALKDKFSLNNDYDFVARLGNKNNEGRYRVRIDQMWRGHPIYDSVIIAEQDLHGLILDETINGDYLMDIEKDVPNPDPNITESEAITIAKVHHEDSDKEVENVNAELFIKLVDDHSRLVYQVDYFVPGIEPVVNLGVDGAEPESDTNDESEETEEPEIPVMFNESPSGNEPRRPFTLLDANTGKVLDSWDGLTRMNPANIQMLLGNPVAGWKTTIELVDKKGLTCYYKHLLPGGKYLEVIVQENFNQLKDKVDRNGPKRFMCDQASLPNYDVTNGAYSPRNAAYKWALDALAYLKTLTNVFPKQTLMLETHHSGIVAHMSGSKISLGDGNRQIHPLTVSDVVMHEVAHYYTELLSKLRNKGQSGAIGESFADMAAVAFKYKQTGLPDFTVGKKVHKYGRRPMRDLCNPKNTYTTTYSKRFPYIDDASQWKQDHNVHLASGVFNKAFCKLAKTSGWNIDTAFKVFADANTLYWGRDVTFNSAACGVRRAAYDLKGWWGRRQVDQAFEQVGVRCSEA